MKKIETPKAPKAIGPYSQAVSVHANQTLLFVSGQLPIDPSTGKFVEGGIREMTRQVLNNIESILLIGGSSMQQIVRVDIFLKDLKNDFAIMNEEYAIKIPGPIHPARQTVQVSELPMGSPIEISCVALGESI
jgi:2-iminobutanoate/2-iminopropanoate deaminase